MLKATRRPGHFRIGDTKVGEEAKGINHAYFTSFHVGSVDVLLWISEITWYLQGLGETFQLLPKNLISNQENLLSRSIWINNTYLDKWLHDDRILCNTIMIFCNTSLYHPIHQISQKTWDIFPFINTVCLSHGCNVTSSFTKEIKCQRKLRH